MPHLSSCLQVQPLNNCSASIATSACILNIQSVLSNNSALSIMKKWLSHLKVFMSFRTSIPFCFGLFKCFYFCLHLYCRSFSRFVRHCPRVHHEAVLSHFRMFPWNQRNMSFKSALPVKDSASSLCLLDLWLMSKKCHKRSKKWNEHAQALEATCVLFLMKWNGETNSLVRCGLCMRRI